MSNKIYLLEGKKLTNNDASVIIARKATKNEIISGIKTLYPASIPIFTTKEVLDGLSKKEGGKKVIDMGDETYIYCVNLRSTEERDKFSFSDIKDDYSISEDQFDKIILSTSRRDSAIINSSEGTVVMSHKSLEYQACVITNGHTSFLFGSQIHDENGRQCFIKFSTNPDETDISNYILIPIASLDEVIDEIMESDKVENSSSVDLKISINPYVESKSYNHTLIKLSDKLVKKISGLDPGKLAGSAKKIPVRNLIGREAFVIDHELFSPDTTVIDKTGEIISYILSYAPHDLYNESGMFLPPKELPEQIMIATCKTQSK